MSDDKVCTNPEDYAVSDFEAQLEAMAMLEQVAKERELLIKTRQSNLPKNIPAKRLEFQKTGKSSLKSDVKKSSAFVKKLRSTNNEGIQQCIRDTESLNLVLYISEIVQAILSITFKATDCSSMVKLCLSFHQKYEDFTEPLITDLKKALLSSADDSDPDAGKKRRVMIRFAIELYQVGLFNDDEFFVQLLRMLLGKVKP
jgi:regulator of nonsense transcripts 2